MLRSVLQSRKRSTASRFTARQRWLSLFGASALLAGLLLLPQQPLLAASQAAPAIQVSPGKLAVVGAQGADLYDGPDGIALRTMNAGTTLTAVGRTADTRWIAVVTEDETSGWVEAGSVVIFGAEQLPVTSELPTDVPTAAADTTQAANEDADAELATPPAEEEAPTATELPPTPTPLPPTATPTEPPTPTPTLEPPTPEPPTQTPLPPTATPLVALNYTSEVIAVVGSDGAMLYAEPGAEDGRTLAVGTALSAVGRSADEQLLYVKTSDGTEGWVMRDAVVAFNTTALPVQGEMMAADEMAAEPTPTMAIEEEAAETGTETGTEENATVEAPAATATPLPAPTATQALRPTPDANGQPTAQVAMSGSRLNIRSGPGTAFAIIGKALPREIFVVQGRNGDSSWVQIAVPDLAGGMGWVASNFVTTSDPIGTLPVTIGTNEPAEEPAAQPTRRVTSSAAAQPAGLTGKMLIQTQWGSTFYLYDLASGALTPITGGLDPALSPDGSQIAFTRIGGSAGGVYLINSDGSNERMIYKASEQLMSPKWSPDGQWLVFSRSNGSYTCNDIAFVGCISDGELFPVPPGGLPPVLEDIRNDVLDGFERVSRPNWQIARINLDGKEYRDIASLNSARAPDWTDAGIVYQSGGGIQITQDRAEDENKKVYHDGWDWDPDWQPGGGRIVFQSKEGPHWEIFAVNPDGSGLVALTRPVTTLVDELPSNVAPVWSPDGQYVAYLSNRTDSNEAGPWRVWVMNADGSNQQPLPINLTINYGFAGEQMISWEQ